MQVAASLPARTGQLVRLGAGHAFIGGLRTAVTIAAVLAAIAAVAVYRYLPAGAPRHGDHT